MKKRLLRMRKILLPTLLVLVLGTLMVMVLGGTTLPTYATTQMDPKTTVYLNPPTINGTGIAQQVTVDIRIRDSPNMTGWKAAVTFNHNLLECIGFNEGDFLSQGVPGKTMWKGTINNGLGVITAECILIEQGAKANGSGRLASATFRVWILGVSNLHLRDVRASEWIKIDETWVEVMIPINIIDVYTTVVDVVTVSNSTGKTVEYGSGFYDHAFNLTLEEISFKVTGPYPGFSNVTIPKTLLPPPTPPHTWTVVINGSALMVEERTVTENTTHTSIYFTYPAGVNDVQITTRFMPSTISIDLSEDSIVLGRNVTISGNITAEDHTGRPNVNVTIQSRPVGAPDWDTVDTVKTDLNSNYTYIWTPETGGTHEVMTSWEGDEETIGYKSDVLTLKVLYDFEPEGVYIETNSTVAEFNSISAFNFSQPLKQISFNITSPYGTTGYSNVTIPKTLLPAPAPPRVWALIINGTLLSTEERIVTENATHTFIYFTYPAGVNNVQITTRFMPSTISIDLSQTSISLGENVTISGTVDPADHTVRENVTVTIKYRRNGGNWTTLANATTDSGSHYSHTWKPGTTGTYQVQASWEGDEETIGNVSDVLTLTVKESSTISITLSSANITLGTNITINGTINPSRPNALVTILFKLGEGNWTTLDTVTTDQNSNYTYQWTPDAAGTYQVKASWPGDDNTFGAESDVLPLTVLKKNSVISITLSSTNITLEESVTISGSITAADDTGRADADVTILYKLSGAVGWDTLATVETDQNSNYTYQWTPDAAGTYQVKASWPGDYNTFGAESDVLTLTVEEAPEPAGIPMEIVIVAVVAIVVIAAVVIYYFVRIRK